MFIHGLLYQAEGNSENLIEFLEDFTFLLSKFKKNDNKKIFLKNLKIFKKNVDDT